MSERLVASAELTDDGPDQLVTRMFEKTMTCYMKVPYNLLKRDCEEFRSVYEWATEILFHAVGSEEVQYRRYFLYNHVLIVDVTSAENSNIGELQYYCNS